MGQTPDPTNGGRRINKLEQKDAVQDVQITELVKTTREIHTMLTDFIGPGGTCDTHRHDAASVATQVKVQWWFIGVVIVGLMGVAFAVLKAGGAG